MGLRVWVVEEQTHARVPGGFPFEPINKPIDREIDPNPYLIEQKLIGFRVAGTHYHLYLGAVGPSFGSSQPSISVGALDCTVAHRIVHSTTIRRSLIGHFPSQCKL
jgi:hypothetical protein